ncbi:hypothetical protein INR49_029227 [Caranx melampygus]|nr:hypothetical protein INR49_029227 [Caranx melampygus]
MPLPKSRKIAVLGYRSVGKSSLTIQFVEGQFVDSYDPTIENTFTKTMTVNGQEYNLQLVDTAGQDEYSIFLRVTPSTLMVTSSSTLSHPTKVGQCVVFMPLCSFEVVRVIHEKLLDMVGNVQVISFEEGKALAESWNAAFLESSAKENQVRSITSNSGGGFPEDDPGGREDGGGSAAESDTLLYDVASIPTSTLAQPPPPTQHPPPTTAVTDSSAGGRRSSYCLLPCSS